MKILVIIPSPTMKKNMQRAIKRLQLPEYVKLITAEAQVENITDLHMENVDAVIARGYSALELEKRYPSLIHIPMEISSFDIFRAVNDIRKHYTPNKVAFCGGYKYMSDSLGLEELLGCPLQVYFNEDFKHIQELVAQAKRDGCDVILGGYSVVICARKLGLKGVMFQTSEEAIVNSIQEAVRSVQIKQNERVKAELYRLIIKNSNEGIIFVDKDGIINIDNKTAQDMVDGKAKCQQRLQEVFPQLLKAFTKVVKGKRPEALEMVQLSKDRTVMANITPVVTEGTIYGAVIVLQDISQIQELEGNIRNQLSEKGLQTRYSFDSIVYRSRTMSDAVKMAQRFAEADSNIIIVGETGTGKELFAQSIHAYSSRKNGPFVAVNCAALPENLLESELFGYVEGAFTGAGRNGKMGMVEQAHKGTLFLDEISEVPIALQIKLLRVIQEREVRRLGSDKVTRVDVRIIAATNKSLKEQVEKGNFRSDLLYRLDVLRLYLPPLRKREGDIELLFEELLDSFSKEEDSRPTLSPEAKLLLKTYNYLGNVRELRNIVERLYVLHRGNEISGADMRAVLYPDDICEEQTRAQLEEVKELPPSEKIPEPIPKENISLFNSKEELEYQKLLEAQEACQGKKNMMAEYLQIDRTTLWRKMKKYKLK